MSMNALISVFLFASVGVNGLAPLALIVQSDLNLKAVLSFHELSKEMSLSIYQKLTWGMALATQKGTPPPTPTSKSQVALNLSAVAVSTSQINLTWISNSGNNTGFYVERALSAEGPWKRVASLPANTDSCAIGGLSASTTYFFRVMTHASPYSNVVSATTLSNLPAGGPTQLVAKSSGSTQINLSWTNNASDVTGFKIERCQGNGCLDFSEIGSLASSDTSYQNNDLAPLTSYSYRVRAYNSKEKSDYSNTATVTTLRVTTPPAVPSQLTAVAVSSSMVNLRWNPSTSRSGLDVVGYNVYQVGVHIVSTPKTSYSVAKLAANTTYCYTVAAYDKAGNRSDQSDPVCTTTKSDSTPDPELGAKPD